MRMAGPSVRGLGARTREKLREVGCSGAEFEAITGTSRAAIRRRRRTGSKRQADWKIRHSLEAITY